MSHQSLSSSRSAPSTFSFYSLILILLVGVLSYSNTLHGPFVFDDFGAGIVNNYPLHLDSLSPDKLTKLGQSILAQGRSVALASFALNYYFGRLNTFGYHLVNLCIHLLTAILVYLFLKLTLSLPSLEERYGKYSGEIALLSGLLFVAHPVQTQAVTYIVQRMASLGAMFYLLSLLAYVKGRIAGGKKRILLYIVSALSALLAFGSKEHTVTLPVVIILYEFFFFQELDFKRFKKKLGLLFALLILPLIVWILYTQKIAWMLKEYETYYFTMGERVLTELRVIIYYISLLLLPLPSRLNLDYDFSISHSLFNPPTTIISLLAVIGLIIVALWIARRRPLFSFGIFWFLVTLTPESSILPLGIIYEHRLYLPSVGFFLVLSALLVKGIGGLKTRPQLKVGLLLVLIIPLSILTHQRNKVWQDRATLWEDAASKSPGKARPYHNLGCIYEERGQLAEAIAYYQRSLEIDPEHKGDHNGLGNIYLRQGKPEQAITEYLAEIKHHPNHADAYYNLGNAYREQGRLAEAIVKYKRALGINAGHKGAHNNLGIIYYPQGKPKQAIAEFLAEIKFNPDNADAYYNLGYIYAEQGWLAEAIAQYQRTLEIDPGYKKAHNNLRFIYQQQGKAE